MIFENQNPKDTISWGPYKGTAYDKVPDSFYYWMFDNEIKGAHTQDTWAYLNEKVGDTTRIEQIVIDQRDPENPDSDPYDHLDYHDLHG
jgi:hypothetical protein